MLRRLLVPCLGALLVACGDGLGPTTDLDLLRISVRITPDTIVAGAPADVAVTLTNPTVRALEVSMCPIYFWVEDPARGAVVGGSRSLACILLSPLVYQPLRFAPLESKTITLRWNGTETQGVSPGQYLVYGWVNVPDRASPPADLVVLAAPAN